jgi:heme-degrading monooxygenase HmoA
MVRVVLEFTARPGLEKRFEEEWAAVAAEARLAPGNLRQTLARVERTTGNYMVVTDWESLEDFRAFERSPAQDRLTAGLRELRQSARMTVSEVLALVDPPPG